MDLEALKAAWEAARAAAKIDPCDKNREAAKRAWEAFDAASPKMATRRYASRAGRRQAKEREAQYRRR